MSVGHCHEHAGELGKAEEHMREAVAIFARTVGESSPLLAGALGSLGKVRVKQGAVADGLAQLERALRIEVEKDAFHLRTIWELLEEIKVCAGPQPQGARAGAPRGPPGSEAHARCGMRSFPCSPSAHAPR